MDGRPLVPRSRVLALAAFSDNVVRHTFEHDEDLRNLIIVAEIRAAEPVLAPLLTDEQARDVLGRIAETTETYMETVRSGMSNLEKEINAIRTEAGETLQDKLPQANVSDRLSWYVAHVATLHGEYESKMQDTAHVTKQTRLKIASVKADLEQNRNTRERLSRRLEQLTLRKDLRLGQMQKILNAVSAVEDIRRGEERAQESVLSADKNTQQVSNIVKQGSVATTTWDSTSTQGWLTSVNSLLEDGSHFSADIFDIEFRDVALRVKNMDDVVEHKAHVRLLYYRAVERAKKAARFLPVAVAWRAVYVVVERWSDFEHAKTALETMHRVLKWMLSIEYLTEWEFKTTRDKPVVKDMYDRDVPGKVLSPAKQRNWYNSLFSAKKYETLRAEVARVYAEPTQFDQGTTS